MNLYTTEHRARPPGDIGYNVKLADSHGLPHTKGISSVLVTPPALDNLPGYFSLQSHLFVAEREYEEQANLACHIAVYPHQGSLEVLDAVLHAPVLEVRRVEQKDDFTTIPHKSQTVRSWRHLPLW